MALRRPPHRLTCEAFVPWRLSVDRTGRLARIPDKEVLQLGRVDQPHFRNQPADVQVFWDFEDDQSMCDNVHIHKRVQCRSGVADGSPVILDIGGI